MDLERPCVAFIRNDDDINIMNKRIKLKEEDSVYSFKVEPTKDFLFQGMKYVCNNGTGGTASYIENKYVRTYSFSCKGKPKEVIPTYFFSGGVEKTYELCNYKALTKETEFNVWLKFVKNKNEKEITEEQRKSLIEEFKSSY